MDKVKISIETAMKSSFEELKKAVFDGIKNGKKFISYDLEKSEIKKDMDSLKFKLETKVKYIYSDEPIKLSERAEIIDLVEMKEKILRSDNEELKKMIK